MTARALTLLLSAGLSLALSLPLGGLAAPAYAQQPRPDVEYVPDDEIPQGVEVHERLGAKVALDTPMLDQDGQPHTPRACPRGKPVLLTFNYSTCPGLCSVQLNRLVEALGSAHL